MRWVLFLLLLIPAASVAAGEKQFFTHEEVFGRHVMMAVQRERNVPYENCLIKLVLPTQNDTAAKAMIQVCQQRHFRRSVDGGGPRAFADCR